ncbi:MAG: hypothetical protein DI565_01755 [Ancylobacter novellus]|uniref:Uncharacterized protein n=1 Tax=Ancylobacter novellus TaxID=921 RepID=A0A2W5MN78_ANCNO|nr:MAG: hypothetical protein DI565_01755 [Ancylobacter novellus]
MAKRIVIGVLILAIAALGVAIWRFNTATEGQPLSGRTRADFVRSAQDGCATRQREADASLDAALVAKFCSCYAEGLAQRVTTADLDRLTGRAASEIQADMRAKMEDADRVCAAKVEEGAN